MYGPDVERPGSYAHNCLLARRLCEKGVRFVQLFHMGWDHHGGLPKAIQGQLNDTDQPTTALIKDLKQRGMLDDTLIVWGGEFGRTVYSQGALTTTDYGRDHHPRAFSLFLAGAGVKKGVTVGATDEYGYNIVENPVSVHDLHATILALDGRRPQEADVPLPGQGFPSHGRLRRAGEENPRLTLPPNSEYSLFGVVIQRWQKSFRATIFRSSSWRF